MVFVAVFKFNSISADKFGMTEPTKEEVAWGAGIYEGEGSCSLTKGRAFRIEIVMTDLDVLKRFHGIFGGTLTGPHYNNVGYKPFWRWSIGSKPGITFLEAVLPWLGERRADRAREAISRWTTERKQISKYDTECAKGHDLTADNSRITDGGCRRCSNAYKREWKAMKRAS